MDIDINEQVTELVRPSLGHLGVELREVAWHSPGGGPRSPGILRVVIDRPGGVSLDDCERASTAISAVLDAYDPISARYTLEVSSPGAERALSGPEEWLDAVGRRVNVRFTAGDSEVVVEGRLLAAAPDAIEVEAREGRNRRRVAIIPTADLLSGRIVVDI